MGNYFKRRNELYGGVAIASLLASLAFAETAFAQEAEAEQDDAIVVTGTRIKRDGFNEPTPATVIGGELMENLGQVNISEALSLIPQQSNFQSDAVSGITAGAATESGS